MRVSLPVFFLMCTYSCLCVCFILWLLVWQSTCWCLRLAVSEISVWQLKRSSVVWKMFLPVAVDNWYVSSYFFGTDVFRLFACFSAVGQCLTAYLRESAGRSTVISHICLCSQDLWRPCHQNLSICWEPQPTGFAVQVVSHHSSVFII